MPRKGGVITLQMLISWMEAGSSWLTMRHECRTRMDAKKWILSTSILWIKEADHGISLYDLQQKGTLSLSPMSPEVHGPDGLRGKCMTSSLFQDEEDTTCHISNEIKKWVNPLKFNLYDQGNKRVYKSQTHLIGSPLMGLLRTRH